MKEEATAKYSPVRQMTDAERIRTVKEIFATVTGKYDFLNHLLSLRRDIGWRRHTVRRMSFFKTHRLLDVATGTADLAIQAAQRHPSVKVTGLDFVQAMITVGTRKITNRGLSDRIRLLRGDALALPFPDHSFDVSTIAFGIRNIPDKLRALQEMKRVIVPGGQVMVLEMTFPRKSIFQGAYHLYLHRILPRVARGFSRNPAAYEYLADSIMNFPDPEAFARLMEEAGLIQVEKYPLDFGITYLHIGVKSDHRVSNMSAAESGSK
ncbi:MAG TPA: bifunctional demethylmenaquinone methyltransferase/2-methoxy-6-polyprenyl-1,4-benzoquinol methylase UbiE [Thermodesulfobacteriota bacterium]|nr:bifunctional demethylmenaquinone methyltransferase/2-methoxy-6-polyprenyl-1,4-benzoquinol methylase UbiE [Thermodesulfobacteriota bacterium]